MVDRYTKAVLTMIALALLGLNVHLLWPRESQAQLFGAAGPTYGDWARLADIKDDKARGEAAKKLVFSIPLMRIQGGEVEVHGSVEVDNTVNVTIRR